MNSYFPAFKDWWVQMKLSISGKTQLIGLLGSPISHSKSPSMQNGVFEALGLDFVYVAFDVGPDSIGDAIKGIKAMKFRGGNVTMPLKREVCKYLDKLTPVAEMAEAVKDRKSTRLNSSH